jgi:hypothetical protein
MRYGDAMFPRIGKSMPAYGEATGTIVARCGGNSLAVTHWS